MRPPSCSRDLGHGISEANRIFRFDGWSRETRESRCVLAQRDMVRGAKAAESAEAGAHDPATGGAGTKTAAHGLNQINCTGAKNKTPGPVAGRCVYYGAGFSRRRRHARIGEHRAEISRAVILQNMQPVRVVPSYSSSGFVGSAAANCSTGVAPFNEGAGDSARPAICFIAFI